MASSSRERRQDAIRVFEFPAQAPSQIDAHPAGADDPTSTHRVCARRFEQVVAIW